MASAATLSPPPLSIQHGIRVVADPGIAVEDVLLAAGEQVGYNNLSHASRMNKAVVVFLKEVDLVGQLVESGVFINDVFIQVQPLATPSCRITVSGVPPFIPNAALEQELRRFGKLASPFRTLKLGCKNPNLLHVQSLRRQVFMFLDCPTQTLEISFKVKHGDGYYTVYASSGNLKCFDCGDLGHKKIACPHRQQAGVVNQATEPSAAAPPPAGDDHVDASSPPTEPSAGQPGAGVIGTDSESTASSAAARPPGAGGESEPVQQQPAAADCVIDSQVAGPSNGAGISAPANAAGTAVCDVTSDTGETGSPVPADEPTNESEQIPASQNDNDEGMDTDCDVDNDDDDDDATDQTGKNNDLYSLDDINWFLDDTYGKPTKVKDYFQDVNKFDRSVTALLKLVGLDVLDQQKRFRLKKHVTAIRKSATGKQRKGRRGKKH